MVPGGTAIDSSVGIARSRAQPVTFGAPSAPTAERRLVEVDTTMTRRIAPVLAGLALTLAACGGGGGGGTTEGEDNPTSASVEAGAERVAYPLAPGRYRLTINEDCDDYTVSITQEGGDFVYSVDNSPIRIVLVNDVPGGSFFIEQTNEACTDWKFDLVRVSGG